ncbi:MAG: arsenate reductase (glutaredoxin) [Rhodobacteraceae bacterium]|nr:arsenate reductase (glutaredoxin) [Paracoccaceae bacterium]
MQVTIYHNPGCGTSRKTLGLIEAAGIAPKVVEYVQTGWTEPQLTALLRDAGLSPQDALRRKNSPAEELGLLDADVSDETLIAAMLKHPILVNRPIVVTPLGTALCRPSETVLPLLG